MGMDSHALVAAGVSALVALMVSATAASARVLPLVANAHVASTAAWEFGDALLEPSVSDGSRGAVLRTPGTMLPPGGWYAISSCLQVHVWASAPVARCATSYFDTSTETTGTRHAGPEPSIPAADATDARGGWARGRVDVRFLSSRGSWDMVASTLPDGSGVPASIDLRPAHAGEDLEPPQQGIDTGVGAGGLNSGGVSSFCVPAPRAATTPLPEGVSANRLGGDAPAYSELGLPIGVDASRASGVVLTLHGGGWATIGAGAVLLERPEADRWRQRGWLTVNASYRACGDAAADVRWFVQRIRERFADLPVVVVGASAGGHLALLAASELPDAVAGVVATGAPAGLADLAADTETIDPRWVSNVAVAAFGQENLDAYSPVPERLRARALLAMAASDPFVPFSQATRLRDEVLAHNPAAEIEAMQLAPGDVPWVHAKVSEPALADFLAREDALARAVGRVYPEPPEPAAGPAAPALTAQPTTPPATAATAAPAATAATAPTAAGPPPITIIVNDPPSSGRPVVSARPTATTSPAASTSVGSTGDSPRPAEVRVLTSGPRSIAIAIGATATGRIELALTLDRRDARRLGVRSRVASVTHEVVAGRRRAVRLHFPRGLQRALRSHRTRVVRASLSATWRTNGTESRATTRFTLRHRETARTDRPDLLFYDGRGDLR